MPAIFNDAITLNFLHYVLSENIFLRKQNLPLVGQVLLQIYNDGQLMFDF